MTLLEYRIFHTVIEQGSFARAAQVLHLTPSAISHAVSSMEESCGFSLFVRGKGGVSLTRSGEGDRGDRNALVDDRNAEVAGDVVAGLHEAAGIAQQLRR